jgi:transitional endoplasmic reticulum ATPase
LQRRLQALAPHEEGTANDFSARQSQPAINFSSIHGNDTIKARLKEAAQSIISARTEQRTARNGILLHGEPGNGKTAFAEALAGELRLPLITLTYADVASHWVGQKSTRVRAAFEQARREQPCVLFIDEVDSFLESREGHSDGTKEDRDLVNALLTLMVDIRQCRVILVAATNHVARLDAASVREGRFDFKVEITPPDLPARLGLLRKGLADNLPRARVDEAVLQLVAQRWNGFSVKRILAVTEELPAYLRTTHGTTAPTQVCFEDLMGALRQLQGQRGYVPENVTPLKDLVFSDNTREMLTLIEARLSDPEHTERHGGTLPGGILFFGPPGTGKTAASKALAQAVGWAFLPATGGELARDPQRLEALYAKAKDLRPALIFVDEADELLRDRQFSASTAATNKLLTLMDGISDRVRDVVWVAATNHPEQIDPALMRGGRFSEKVVFDLPSERDLAEYVRRWLETKRVQLEQGLAVEQVTATVGASSIADAQAVLQTAVNRAVARRELPVRLRLHDVQRALDVLHGASS